MTFVWKVTCRRLQSSGTLARFAEGALSERERSDVDTHIARCPTCKAAVADALAVASLLRSVPPAASSNGVAASGNLWAKLEAEILRTPQDASVTPIVSPSAPVPVPRLQRFGHWLATPGALPFGSVAAAAVVVMVGAVMYQRVGSPPADEPVASVRRWEDANFNGNQYLAPSHGCRTVRGR
jgi:anti-sigma factor RsiW